MPRRNLGTLLENIVLFETVRLLTDSCSAGSVVEFVNSFVMPPLSNWGDRENDKSLTPGTLERMGHRPKYRNEFSEVYRLLYDFSEERGPSGALLAALVLKRSSLVGRYWLNDLADDHPKLRYKDEPTGLAQVETVASEVLKTKSEDWSISTCRVPYPDSFEHLRTTLQDWAKLESPVARVGYLDPDDYVIPNRNSEKAHTDPSSVGTFLRLLKSDFDGPVGSVHFLFGQKPEKRQELIESLYSVGYEQGYAMVHFISGNYVLSLIHI